MTDLRPAPVRSADPVAAAEDALILLVTGRVDMAKRLLDALPGLIGDALAAAKPVPPTPTQFQLAEAELARVRAHVRALVAEVLRIGTAEVPPIAAGRVGLAEAAWRKVLREIGG